MQKPTAIYLGWTNSQTSKEVEDILRDSFELKFVRSFSFGEKTDQEALAKLSTQFLFTFGPLIVRKPLLTSSTIAAINFHTAPPKWPGRGSCSHALLARDTEFGITAHLISEAIDAGPILRVLRFPITQDDDAESLHEKTLRKIPELVKATLMDLRSNNWQPVIQNDETWERKALKQKELFQLMRIDESDTDEQVALKIRAFSHSKKPGPFIERNGIRFWYMKAQNSDA